MSTLGRQAVPCTRGWRSISGTAVLNIQTSQLWLNTASTWDTAFNFTIPQTSPLWPNTEIAWLGRLLRLGSVPTLWRERWVFASASHVRLSAASSRNLRNMTPDLQGYAGQCTLGSLVPRVLGQCSLGSPALPPDKILYQLWPATCSPISTDPSTLLSTNFPFDPLSFHLI
jgi:hypothetical protein